MPEQPLKNTGILVTRPAHQAEGLCQLIEEKGGQAYRLPLIEIVPPANEAETKANLARLAEFDSVIFISANAVQRCYLYIGEAFPSGPRVACVGQATARQFENCFGRAADIVPADGFNSEALLASEAFQQVEGQQILLLKGEGGRELLASTLADRGANVGYANLYKRALPAEARQQLGQLQQHAKPDLIVFTSGEAIDNLSSILDESTRQRISSLRCLVIHDRLVDKARQTIGFADIIVSDGPSDEQIVQCIEQWRAR